MEQELLNSWKAVCTQYSQDKHLIDAYWQEILSAYTSKGRYYHNLEHIYTLLHHAKKVKPELQHPDAVTFAIFYHDIVYRTTRQDNEHRSADIAKERLTKLGVDLATTDLCIGMILATVDHDWTERMNKDVAYFLDMDLAILASTEEDYDRYAENIRKEYKHIPGILYKRGRRKVLQHFLQKESIYFTEEFGQPMESKAVKNLERELNALS